jgi:hypothetical protein
MVEDGRDGLRSAPIVIPLPRENDLFYFIKGLVKFKCVRNTTSVVDRELWALLGAGARDYFPKKT